MATGRDSKINQKRQSFARLHLDSHFIQLNSRLA
jgi:hypothetical protein